MDAPGLANSQGLAAVSVLLCSTHWKSSVSSSQQNCDLWITPHESRKDTVKSVDMNTPTPEQVHLDVAVAMVILVLQQMYLNNF